MRKRGTKAHKGAHKVRHISFAVPVAMIVSPGASMPPGGLMKQLLGAVVWNCNTGNTCIE
jgi:hypothetical protein